MKLDRQDERASERVLGVFAERADDGSFRYSDEELERSFPLLVLEILRTSKDVELPEPLERMMIEFGRRIGFESSTSQEDARLRIERFRAANPPSTRLIAALDRHLREELGSATGDDAPARAFFGARRSFEGALPTAMATAFAVRAGPMARFKLR